MSVEQQWTIVGCALALCLVLAVLGLLRARAASRDVRRLSAQLAELSLRIEAAEVERLRDAPVSSAHPSGTALESEHTFVITELVDHAGEVDPASPHPQAAPARIDGRLFADLVARETLVKSAGLVHGIRRALAPETRNRIRFEMRREVKRSRRDRRTEMKVAWREYQERQRGLVTFDEGDVA